MAESGDDKTQVLSRPQAAAAAAAPTPAALLRCVDTSVLKDPRSGAEIRLDGAEVTVGRGDENDVTLVANGISRAHARLFPAAGAWAVEDLGSTNGTRVNNSKIERRALADGDTVAFGRACYKFSVLGAGDEKPRRSTHELDLGDSDKTLVMRPGQLHPAPPGGAADAAGPDAGAAPTPAATTSPGAATKTAATRPAAASRPTEARGRPADKGSGAGLWVLVVVLLVAIAGGAAWVLGLL